jgi:rhamnose transport system permease protein
MATDVADPMVGRQRSGLVIRGLQRWETALLGLLIATIVFGTLSSPHFFTTTDLFFIGINVGEIAIMALPLTLIVITGEIDLSVASMLGLSSSLLGYLFLHGWNIWPAMLAVLVVGAVGGALNGVLVTRLGLPSIAVTIGTLTLFRGLALIILGAQSVGNYPASLTKIGIKPIPHTEIAYSVGIFLVLAVVYAVVLHATPVGRSIFAIGLQEEAAFFSGIRVKRIKFLLYVLSGLVCAFAGILWTFRFATSRYDAGTGLELNVVAIALLGGVSIFGGRGSILGVVLAAAVLACFLEALTLINVSAQVQNIVTGGLLLLSVVVPNAGDTFRRLRAWLARSRGGNTAAAFAGDVPLSPTAANAVAGTGTVRVGQGLDDRSPGGSRGEGGGTADPGD